MSEEKRERKEWVNSLIAEDYKGLSTLIIAGKVEIVKGEIDKPELLNGFVMNVAECEAPAVQYRDTVVMWNQKDESLYLVSKYIGKINPVLADSLSNNTVDNWPQGAVPISEEKYPGIEIKATTDLEEIYPTLMPLEAPKGHHYLGVIFDTPEKQMMYEEFLADSFVYDKIRKMCVVKGLKVTDAMVKTTDLPMHKKDSNTGEVFISDKIVDIFTQYQFSKNYMSFDVGTPEHDLGKIMMLDPKFCDYMLTRAKSASEGKVLSEENYLVQLKKAIKNLEADPYKMSMYENNLEVVETVEEES